MNKVILTLLMLAAVSFTSLAQNSKADTEPPPPKPKTERGETPPPEPCKVIYAEMPEIYSLRLGMEIAEVKKLYPNMTLADLAREMPEAKNLEKLKIKLALAGDADLKPLGHAKDTDYVSFFFMNGKLLGIVGILKFDRTINSRRAAANRISGKLGLPDNWRLSTILKDGALQMDCGDFSLIADRLDRSPMFMILSLEMMNDEILELFNLRNST